MLTKYKPLFIEGNVEVALAQREDADQIVEMFESALGNRGILAPGHDPYPEPALFTKEGIESLVDNPERRLVIAKVNSEVAGGMIIDALSPFHCEFNCMAVRQDRRGQGIGSLIVRGAKQVVEDSLLTVNATELVTHSMISQSAHFHEGYSNICGFGFCHYPNVFFKNHPESVLWVTLLQGRLMEDIKKVRQHSGHIDGKSTEEHHLISEILRKRIVYVPARYIALAKNILKQFENILDYAVVDPTVDSIPSKPSNNANSGKLTVNYIDGYAHSYLIYTPQFKFDQGELDQAISSVKERGKRYMLVRIPVNDAESVNVVNHLLEQGFVFHSLLPLFGLRQDVVDKPEFYDIITMQWIAPHILQDNPLPGEVNSVVNVYGYPANLSGEIVKQIRKDQNTNLKMN